MAAAATGLPLWFVQRELAAAEATGAATSPNDRPGLALIGCGGQGQNDSGGLPPIVHIPIAVSRGWEQRVQKASLPEGERLLPAAGLIFFDHRGKSNSLELIYNGPAGKATLTLQP